MEEDQDQDQDQGQDEEMVCCMCVDIGYYNGHFCRKHERMWWRAMMTRKSSVRYRYGWRGARTYNPVIARLARASLKRTYLQPDGASAPYPTPVRNLTYLHNT